MRRLGPALRPRIGWVTLGLALVVLDLAFLVLAVRDYRQQETLHRLSAEPSLESLSRAVEQGGELRDRLLVNLGNYNLRRGIRLRSVAEVRAAVAYYREALRIEPDLVTAKHNLELAVRILESFIPPREPREPLPPGMIRSSEMPLKPNDI